MPGPEPRRVHEVREVWTDIQVEAGGAPGEAVDQTAQVVVRTLPDGRQGAPDFVPPDVVQERGYDAVLIEGPRPTRPSSVH